MGKAKKVTPGDWKATYAHLPFKKRYSMATDVDKLKNYAGRWNVKLNGNNVGSAKVDKKTVDVKTQQGIQCFYLEANEGSMTLTSNAMKKKCAFWNAVFISPDEIKWEMKENEFVKVLAPLYWERR